MKKRNFVLTGIALGLSVFATSLSAQAAIPNEIVEQGSLAPMLEKAQAAVYGLLELLNPSASAQEMGAMQEAYESQFEGSEFEE